MRDHKIRKIYPILIAALFLSAFFMPSGKARAETMISGVISGDVQWTQAESPIIIDGSVAMERGSQLIIDPGVVVKLKHGSQFLEGNGTITAIGTADQPIIFTSFIDDTGGDSNLDGDVSKPASGDWERMVIGNPNDQITRAEFRYGQSCLYLTDSIVIFGVKVNHCGYGIYTYPSFTGAIENTEITDSVYGIYIQGSSLDHVKYNRISRNTYGIWFGGTPWSMNISNNDIFDNDYGLATDSTPAAVRDNNIYDNTNLGFGNYSSEVIDAVDNWWGDASGPTHPTLNPGGLGNGVTDRVDFDPWTGEKIDNSISGPPALPTISISADHPSIASGQSATISWTSTDATSCTVDSHDGTSGSFSTGSLIATTAYPGTCTGPGGSASGSVTVTVEDNLPPDDSEPSGLRPVVIIPGIMGSELYDGQDFIWPNVGLLIDRVHDYFLLDSLSLDENGDSIKDISLGNIVTDIKIPIVNKTLADTFKSLITNLESKNYVLNDNYFLFPYDWRLNLDNSVDLLKDKIEAIKSQTGFDKVDIIAHSMGGLLTEDYIKEYGSDSVNKLIFVGTPHLGAPKSAKVLLEGDLGIPFNLVNQETIKQLSLNSPSVYELLPRQKYFDIYQGYLELQGASLALLPYNSTRLFLKNQKLNSNLIDQAEIFFAKDLADVNFGSAKVYNIAGCALATQATYSFSSSKNHITSTGYGSGDGTVPLVSADYVSGGSNSKYYAKGVKHSEMPSNSAVRQLILGILGDNVLPDSKISDSSGFCNFQGQQLTWKSPVAVHIYDQFGNHAGPTADGGFENNLTGVDYEIIAGEKFIYIPSNDGNTYAIQGIGEATGTFDLVISTIDNGNVTLSVVYNDVNITQASQVTVDVSEAQPSVEFDFDGDGTFVSLASDSSVTGEAVNDRTPPMTSSAESGSNFGPKQITLTATDDNSGVSKIKYSLDNVSFYDYYDPIVISRADNYAVYYYAIDKAGNDEAMNTASVIIDVEPRRAGLEYFTPPVILETPTTETPAEMPKDQGQVLGEIKTVTIRDSTLVLDTTDGRTVYIIGNNGQKFGFTSERVFRGLGYAFANVIPADLSSFQLGGLIESADATHPNGSLVINNGIIWYINHGLRSAFQSLEVFNSLGFNLNQVVPANNFDLKLEEQIIN